MLQLVLLLLLLWLKLHMVLGAMRSCVSVDKRVVLPTTLDDTDDDVRQQINP